MGFINRIFLGHKINTWVSNQTLIAARTLNQVAADLIANAEDEIAAITLKDGVFGQADFIQTKIAPMIQDVADPIASEIINSANLTLWELVEEEAVWVRSPAYSESPSEMFEGVRDVANAAVPIAAGMATAGSLPFIAVTTTTAWFGLVATTAISWPVVVGGSAIAALGIATGAVNIGRMPERVRGRLREAVRKFIIAALIEGKDDRPSILEQLRAEFERTAERAKAA